MEAAGAARERIGHAREIGCMERDEMVRKMGWQVRLRGGGGGRGGQDDGVHDGHGRQGESDRIVQAREIRCRGRGKRERIEYMTGMAGKVRAIGLCRRENWDAGGER